MDFDAIPFQGEESVTLVINTLESGDYSEQINAILAGKDSEIEIINTAGMNIAHCVGCNQCWLRTPGICAIKDDYEIIIKKLVKADNVWFVTDTRFGFTDYRGKRVMDRLMPMLNMYLTFRDGWMRHQLRYRAQNIGIIYKGDGNQQLLEEWTVRSSANIGGHSLGAIALDKRLTSTATTEFPRNVASEPERVRHVAIINGSPRIKKFSNTNKIIQSFAQGLDEAGTTHELYSLSNRLEWETAREAISLNQDTIIALPLYVDCVPALLLEFLGTLPANCAQPAKMSFILHSGFEEGHQLRLGERLLQSLSEQLGYTYGGMLVKGGSFMLRMFEGKNAERVLNPYRAMGRLFAENGNFFFPEAAKFTGPEQFPWLVRKMIGMIFRSVIRKHFDRFAKEWGCTRPLEDKPYSE